MAPKKVKPKKSHTVKRTTRSSVAMAIDANASSPDTELSIPKSRVSETLQTDHEASDSGSGCLAPLQKNKRRGCQIPLNIEENLAEWIREHECLWNTKVSDYRMRSKKDRLWQEKSEELGFSVEHLKTWFKSLRDFFTRIDRGKSGDGCEITEREQWIKNTFAFLRKTVRHRSQSVGKSIKAIIAEKKGDLNSVEAALAEQGQNVDDNEEDSVKVESMPSNSMTGKRRCKGRRKQSASASEEEEALRAIQLSVAESRASLQALKSVTLQTPTMPTSRTTFANYVRDSLLSMSDKNFKKARKEINKVLTSVMDEDDDSSSETPSTIQSYVTPEPSQGVRHSAIQPRPSQYASHDSTSQIPLCNMYQPYPDQWRMPPPGSEASPWQSQSQKYMSLYNQQPLLRQQKRRQEHQNHLQYIQGSNHSSRMPSTLAPTGVVGRPIRVATASASQAPSSPPDPPVYTVLSKSSQVLNQNVDETKGDTEKLNVPGPPLKLMRSSDDDVLDLNMEIFPNDD